MISYAANGRISGDWMVQRLLSRRLIYPGREDISWSGNRHRLSGLQFSAAVRNDPEIMEDFRNVARNVLYLLYFAEGQPYLHVPAEEISGEFSEKLNHEDLTGITLLALFSDGTIRASFSPEETVVYADRLFLSSVRDAEALLQNLIRVVFLYSGEPGPERITVREETEISMQTLSDDTPDEGAPEDSPESGPESGQVPEIFMTEREKQIEKNVRSTLTTLSQMIRDIDDISLNYSGDQSKFWLSFSEGKRLDCDYYSIAVPDGFAAKRELDGADYIMWLPNRENPEEWEASVFAVYPGMKKALGNGTGSVLKQRSGNALHVEAVIPCGVQSVCLEARIIGVTEESEQSAQDAAMLLFHTVRAL